MLSDRQPPPARLLFLFLLSTVVAYIPLHSLDSLILLLESILL